MQWVIVGLGNPGEQYAHTRHNAGRIAVEYFMRTSDTDAAIIIPDTYMNNSGKAVQDVKDAAHLIVVHDDVDIPLGRIRIAVDRGSGGHKGVESIIKTLKTKKFIRVRIGIAPTNIFGKMRKPPSGQRMQDFVLGQFSRKEQETLEHVVKKTHDALNHILSQGVASAMNVFN
tara:strand:+ start:10248 stop:10763 length:516 start_codon:yes stop_codon:yes gene_type:complete